MNAYEVLINEADSLGITTKEKPLSASDGRIAGKRIAIRKDIGTSVEKACVLAEELGHYHTTCGDILDQSNAMNRKQERRARLWSYNKRIGLCGLINVYEHGCQSAAEAAEYLDVTVAFFNEALKCYREIYGIGALVDNYYIRLVPTLCVGKII